MIDKILEEQSIVKQNKLREKICLENKLNLNNLKYVAGVDLAYWGKDGEEFAVCCIVVIDYNTKEVIEKKHTKGKIDFPYIPGCLAFREMPLILETVEKLEVEPDLYVFDGNGYLHPRHMGIATHAGIVLNKPSIGVAKSYFKVYNTDYIEPREEEGSYTDIIIKDEVYGRVLRTHRNVKPVFISVGNFVDIDTCTEVIKNLVTKESHIPIPTRIADLYTHEMRRKYK